MTLAEIRSLQEHLAPTEEATLFLGAATVLRLAGATPIVQVEGQPVRAKMALAFPYNPQAGDELLVVGKGGEHFVIGLLHAGGEVSLRFVGDVKLQAIGGRLDLAGDEGVRVRGRKVEVLSKKFELLAESVSQKAEHWFRRVREVFDARSGEKRELVDGDLSVVAERATTLTRGVTTINGKEIHLG